MVPAIGFWMFLGISYHGPTPKKRIAQVLPIHHWAHVEPSHGFEEVEPGLMTQGSRAYIRGNAPKILLYMVHNIKGYGEMFPKNVLYRFIYGKFLPL